MYLIKIVNVHGPAFEKFDEIVITLSTKQNLGKKNAQIITD